MGTGAGIGAIQTQAQDKVEGAQAGTSALGDSTPPLCWTWHFRSLGLCDLGDRGVGGTQAPSETV